METFKTMDLEVGGWLLTKNHKVEVKRLGRKLVFEFNDTPQLRIDLGLFLNDTRTLIKPRTFAENIRRLKMQIYTGEVK